MVIGVTSSSKGKGVGEVGLGFAGTLVVASGNGFWMTQPPPWGWMGKGILRSGLVLLGEVGDVCSGHPIDPDEVGKRIFSLDGTVFVLSIAESRASSPTVVGMGRGVAAEFFEPEAFFGEGEGSLGVYPNLEVTG